MVVINECTIASSTIDIVCSVATGEYVAENNISVFPNPTNEILYIQTQLLVDKIEMYNSTGTYLYDIENKKVDVSNLHAGFYMLIFYRADGKTIVKKVMVM